MITKILNLLQVNSYPTNVREIWIWFVNHKSLHLFITLCVSICTWVCKILKPGSLEFLFVLLTLVFAYDGICVNYTACAKFMETMLIEKCQQNNVIMWTIFISKWLLRWWGSFSRATFFFHVSQSSAIIFNSKDINQWFRYVLCRVLSHDHT